MPENSKAISQDTTWENAFRNKHVSSAETTEFVSSYRTVIYARPAGKKENGATTLDNLESGSDITQTQAKEFRAIGVVQAYNWNEQRNIDYIFELGSDIPYLVPGRTIGQISLQRVMLNGQDVVNALYNEGADGSITGGGNNGGSVPLSSIKDITIPFDLLFVAFATNGSGKTKYSRVFKNCQIESRSESINAGAIVLAESVSIRYETIVGITLPKVATTE